MRNFLKFFALLLVLIYFIPPLKYHFFKILFIYFIVVFAKKFYNLYQIRSEALPSHSKKDETIKKTYRLSEKAFNLLLIYNKLLTPDENWSKHLEQERKEFKENSIYSDIGRRSYFHYQGNHFPCTLVLALPEDETTFDNYLTNSKGKLSTHYYIKCENEILTRLSLEASNELYHLSDKKREISANLYISEGPFSKYMEIFDKTTCREYWEVNTFNDNPFDISITFSLLKEDETQKYHFTFYNKNITYPLLWEAYRKTLFA